MSPYEIKYVPATTNVSDILDLVEPGRVHGVTGERSVGMSLCLDSGDIESGCE
jgi:hypothetical protein